MRVVVIRGKPSQSLLNLRMKKAYAAKAKLPPMQRLSPSFLSFSSAGFLWVRAILG